jgi:flagellar operon protein
MTVSGIEKIAITKTSEAIGLKPGRPNQGQTPDFRQAFNAALGNKTDLKFSNHALARLSRRGVSLNDQTVSRLDNAVLAAGKKGADQSLVLLDEMAFVVSIKNKTVITAMETDQMKEGVFTQIDSAVIG